MSNYMNMRAKLKIESIQKGEQCEVLHFRAVYKDEYDATGKDENNTYALYTPGATLEMIVTNPELLNTYSVGDTFYVDFVKI